MTKVADKTAPTPPSGGLGGELIDKRTAGKDLRLIRSAIRQGWKIPERAFEELPEAMLELALSDEADVRARVSAAKVLCTMQGQAAGQTTVNVGVVVQTGEDLLD